jgi:hypothetical protein
VIQIMGNTIIMAEYLARHCDRLLRKKEEINLEKILNQIKVRIFILNSLLNYFSLIDFIILYPRKRCFSKILFEIISKTTY